MTLLRGMASRVQDPTSTAKAGAIAGAALQAFVSDAFAYLFLVLLISNVADWIFGRHAARARIDPATGRSSFSSTKSRNGLVAKGAQLTVLLLLRSLEAVIPFTGLPEIMGQGFGSAALCLLLVVEDLESIERHSITLGAKRIPLLSPILSRIRLVTGGDRRDPNTPPPEEGPRRRSSDNGVPPAGAAAG